MTDKTVLISQEGAIVFTGAGDFFCSGGDLNLLARRRELPEAERREKLVYMVESQADAEAAEGIGAFLGKRRADFAALRRKNPDAP